MDKVVNNQNSSFLESLALKDKDKKDNVVKQENSITPSSLVKDNLEIKNKVDGENPSTIFDFGDIPAATNVEESKEYLDARRNAIIQDWANAPMEEWTGWKPKGKIMDPSGTAKVTIHNRANAKLITGVDVENANRVLLNGKQYSGVGTHTYLFWGIQKKGDYDFAMRGLTALVNENWDNPNLKPETRLHIAKNLLTEEGSNHINKRWLLGIVPETENHILMTETSRYLKNQLVHNHGMSYSTHNLKPKEYDNEKNGFNEWFVDHLSEFARNDFDEYNSRPYQGYTTKAIQTLYEYADDPEVKKSAQIILDFSAAKFATQSSELRRVVPFRRRQGYQDHNNVMEKDSESARYSVLAGNFGDMNNKVEEKTKLGKHNMLPGASMGYRVPDVILDLMIDKGNNPYFMQNHHENSEIVYSEENFLISAGGHYHDWSKMPFSDQENGIPMPTVVMFKGSGPNMSNMIKFLGRGDGSDRINNTGVYENVAFGIRPELPDNLVSDLRKENKIIESGNWKYMELDNVFVAMNSQSQKSPENYAPSVGFVEVVDKKEFKSLSDFKNKVEQNNNNKSFKYYGDNKYTTTKGKTIQFEMAEPLVDPLIGKVRPPKNKKVEEWSVKKVWDGNKEIPIEREFEKWDLANSYTMNKENDGQNNDYVIKADGTGQIIINNPATDQSLLMSLADQHNPIRIEQKGEAVNLSEKADITRKDSKRKKEVTIDLKGYDKVNYISMKWDEKSNPDNVKLYILEKGSNNWTLAENRDSVYTSRKHEFRTDFEIDNKEVRAVKLVATGRRLNLEGNPEVYKSWN